MRWPHSALGLHFHLRLLGGEGSEVLPVLLDTAFGVLSDITIGNDTDNEARYLTLLKNRI